MNTLPEVGSYLMPVQSYLVRYCEQVLKVIPPKVAACWSDEFRRTAGVLEVKESPRPRHCPARQCDEHQAG